MAEHRDGARSRRKFGEVAQSGVVAVALAALIDVKNLEMQQQFIMPMMQSRLSEPKRVLPSIQLTGTFLISKGSSLKHKPSVPNQIEGDSDAKIRFNGLKLDEENKPFSRLPKTMEFARKSSDELRITGIPNHNLHCEDIVSTGYCCWSIL